MISQNRKFDNISIYWLNIYSNYQSSISIGLNENTVEWRLKHIRGFLKFMTKLNITCNNFQIKYVYEYLSSLEKLSPRTREHRAVCIRFFLNYLYELKYIVISGKTILPKIKCNKSSKIISYYSNEEISKLLNQIDNKLDLAFISLIVYLGIRTTDIVKLTLDNFNWKENTMSIVQSKTNIINSLPLIEEVKYPLIDYLKNYRPLSDNKIFFLNETNMPINDKYIYYSINKYFLKARIDITNKHHGAHSLRHSLATGMINENQSIYTISTILGHSNIDDTKVYAKVNTKSLKKISLEVPAWKN